MDKGIYLIIGHLDQHQNVSTKAQSFSLKSGWYYYCGSAMNGLSTRVLRHLSPQKKHHWHIDFLMDTLHTHAIATYITGDNQLEHELANLLARRPEIEAVPGFGAGDCACMTHLFSSKYLNVDGIFLELFQRQMEITIEKLARQYSGIQTPVERFQTPWELLVSCIISLRTKDEVTGPAAARLFDEAPDPDRLANLPEERIAELIYPAGFYKTKAKNLRKVAEIIATRYLGQVPDNREELLALPNVGIKTANLVLANGYGQFEICVDTHVHRISNRLGWIRTRTPEESEKVLKQYLPNSIIIETNGLMVKHGQNICKPRKPNCAGCPIQTLCKTGMQNEVDTV